MEKIVDKIWLKRKIRKIKVRRFLEKSGELFNRWFRIWRIKRIEVKE